MERRKIIVLALIPIFLVVITALVALNITAVFEPPLLLLLLNTLFTGIIPMAVAYFAFQTFRLSRSVGLLLIGSGMLVFGLGSIIAGSGVSLPDGPNINVTIYNTGCCIGAAFVLSGALAGLTRPWQEEDAGNPALAAALYGIIIVFIALFSLATVQGIIPPFFVQGVGPTVVRQVVLGAAIAFFAISALTFWVLYDRKRVDFFFWYSVSLALIAIGLGAVLLEHTVGSPIGWAGRIAQYTGAACILIAFLDVQRKAALEATPVQEVLNRFFSEAGSSYRALVEGATDAIIVLDPYGRVIIWNAAAERMFQYPRKEAVGAMFADLAIFDRGIHFPGTGMPGSGTGTTGDQKPDIIEIDGKRKDGSTIPVELTTSTHTVDGRNMTTCIFRDLTRRKQVEKKLKESEERLRLAQKASGTGIWDWNVATNEISWDPQLFAVFGLDPEKDSASFDAWDRLLHPEDLAVAHSRIEQALKEHSSLNSEYRIIRPDGEVRWIHALGQGMYNEQGRPVRMAGTCMDITVRKTAERELQETKEYFENLITYANAPIIVWDPEFRITRFNHAFEHLTGRAAEEVMGRKLDILFPEETKTGSMEQIQKTFIGEHWDAVEIPILNKDGSARTVLWNSATIYDEDTGLVTATIAQGLDITDRKQADQKILHLASFPEMNPMPVIELDLDGRVLFCNEATHTILKGLGVSGDPSLFLPAELEDIIRNMNHRTNRTCRAEIKIGDATFIENIHLAPDLGVVRLYVNDITTLRNTANELQRYVEKLARSNQELEQFAYVASHDLREPLRMVTSFSQLLEKRYKGRLDADAGEFIQYIVDGATRMDILIKDLLEYSRITSRAQPFELVDMNGVVRDVKKNLAVMIRENQARISTDILPIITADRSQMIQVIQNLVANAITYRSEEPPDIRVTADQRGGTTIFSVRDNGIGIDPEYHEKIFEIFQRLHSRDRYQGTGIGLAICRRIIERHDGQIWVESEEGKGSTFYFTIPEKQGGAQ
jgi:PAS domain S-box-containing protein